MSEIRIEDWEKPYEEATKLAEEIFDETQRIGDAIGGVNGSNRANELWENVLLRDRRDDIMNVVVYRGFIGGGSPFSNYKIDLSGEESLMGFWRAKLEEYKNL